MKIGIDGRLIAQTGVGRYIRNLIAKLSTIDTVNDYVVYVRRVDVPTFVIPNSRWQVRVTDIPWHSIAEQIFLPFVYGRDELDVVHVPYFTIPIFYLGNIVVTIHDLTVLHVNTGKATTLPKPLYLLRRLGYWIVLYVGLRSARHIIAVSESTKRDLERAFSIPTDRITVTYEGIDPAIRTKLSDTDRALRDPYILYVGNAYPHKNLERLIEAFSQYIQSRDARIGTVRLALVGSNDYFYTRLRAYVTTLPVANLVTFCGGVTDEELAALYTHAQALVFPSLMEGFGLPALEAMSFGCPVICSDISVFHEILGEYATYFNPTSISSICDAVTRVLEKKKPTHASVRTEILKKFDWNQLARDTLSVYETVGRHAQ